MPKTLKHTNNKKQRKNKSSKVRKMRGGNPKTPRKSRPQQPRILTDVIPTHIKNAKTEKDLLNVSSHIINYMFLEKRDRVFRLNAESILTMKEYYKILGLIFKDLIYNPKLSLDEKKDKLYEILDKSSKMPAQERSKYMNELLNDIDDEFAEVVDIDALGEVKLGDAKEQHSILYKKGYTSESL